jgi:hypothetical protein
MSTSVNMLAVNYNKGSYSQLSASAKTAAKGIYGLKALFTSPALVINVRNGSTNATSDFYADTAGNLTTISGTTISSWLSGATGYITTWYDQSTAGNHATQVLQASQPKIDYANNQIDFKTSAFFDLPNGTVPSGNSNYTIVLKHNTFGSSSQSALIHSGTQGTQNFVNAIEINSGNYLNFWWANDLFGGAAVTGTIVTAKYDNTVGRTMYKNGSQSGSDAQTTRNSTTINNLIAKDPRSVYLNGELYYVAIFNAALSDADRTIVENQPAVTSNGPIFFSQTISPNTLFQSISSGAASSAKGIYSLYAINGTNPLVINVRNGSTSATSDFYGSTSGSLTTSGGQTISAWLAGATGYITTWYDQSGLGNHAVQATAGTQPSITLGTPNLIDFSGSKYFTVANQVMPIGNGVFTTITKLGTHGTSVQIGMWGFGTTGSSGCVGLDLRVDFSPNRYEEFFYGTGDVTGPTYTPNATVSGVYNGSSHTLYLNGSQIGTSAVSSRNGIAGNQYIGAINFIAPDVRGLVPYNGTMKDLYIFSTALSTQDRNILETGYVGVFVPMQFYKQYLYSFTTFTFTPMGATGASGPSSITYGTNTPGYGTGDVMTLSGGIQYWTVPSTGNYTIVAAGAAGGAGTAAAGKGAVITVTVPLTKSSVIKILVGQVGGTAPAGGCQARGAGGGGTFVTTSSNSPIIVAGGGGGSTGYAGVDASLTTSGNNSSGGYGLGGTGGGGGYTNVSTVCDNHGGSGAGITGNGANNPTNQYNGTSFINGGTGGSGGGGSGGFGGGGGLSLYCGGGGGGYSGGGCGELYQISLQCNCGATQAGGGGGSYAIVSFTSSAVTNTGDGYVTITKL